MFQNIFDANVFDLVYDNSLDAFVPELWAAETLAILSENMVMANLVHRDFENQIQAFGDIVNTRRPGEFTAKRKTVNDDVTIQNATATNVPVPLDQFIHTSFLIRDGEESKSFKNLVTEYLMPAGLSMAQIADKILLGQHVHFLNNYAGKLGGMAEGTVKGYILDTRNRMNVNKAYMSGRNLILTPNAETSALKLELFTAADKVGDQGTALREASLGRRLGFDIYMCQNTSSISVGNTIVTGAIDNMPGYPATTTALTVDGLSAAITNGTWVTIDGDDFPHRVAGTTGGTVPTVITLASPGLRRAVEDDAVVTLYTPGAINEGSGYAAGYSKELTVNGFTVAPQVGQIVSFGTSTTSAVYTIIEVTGTTGITLDRPLEANLSNGDAVNIGPAGEYNFAFHKNALAFVVRPLATPMSGTGARSGVMNGSGLSVRVTITYNGTKQGHLVTLDMLAGVKVLDTNLGAVLLG